MPKRMRPPDATSLPSLRQLWQKPGPKRIERSRSTIGPTQQAQVRTACWANTSQPSTTGGSGCYLWH